ncbi:hypothetical protein EB820_01225 [Brevibacillus agri]|uniref:Uncharacterized protein n=1 Tax=Brevibacillus agri TaxID=51101 RepID=A0A3M8BDB4_9BACL|nr:hypothetical protein D478_25123 [Brevibacillus agri BAB-2500]MBG9563971.1 hypothetical protein [Brevibacillus agri]QAV15421.1 hypothetical protein BA6348_23215 [Brevibacillus agri]RNB61283.1 hypothetical protein EB820_01225 [Brevibacillus agri]
MSTDNFLGGRTHVVWHNEKIDSFSDKAGTTVLLRQAANFTFGRKTAARKQGRFSHEKKWKIA